MAVLGYVGGWVVRFGDEEDSRKPILHAPQTNSTLRTPTTTPRTRTLGREGKRHLELLQLRARDAAEVDAVPRVLARE